MMNTIVRLVLVSMLVMVAAPAYSAVATQMWRCEMEAEATEEGVKARAGEWLKAARGMKGGEGLEAYVYFPVAVNATGQMDMMFVVVAPSFAEWGQFWDAYIGSPAAEIDKKNEKLVICPDSVLWESFKVE